MHFGQGVNIPEHFSKSNAMGRGHGKINTYISMINLPLSPINPMQILS